MSTKTLSLTALLLAVSMIIGVIENFTPPIIPFLPYIKIGFSNIVIIVAIVLLNYKYAFVIISLKSITVPLLVGNPMMILYSLPSAIISTLVSWLLIKTKKFGIATISALSAIIFNFTQLTVAMIMTNYLVFGYLPYFILIGGASGFVTGIISFFIIKHSPKI